MRESGLAEDEAAMAKPARQLESLALQAVAACDAAQAQDVWLLAFEKLAALGSSSKKLIQALLRQLTGMRRGPPRVSGTLPTWPCQLAAYSATLVGAACSADSCAADSSLGLCGRAI